MPRLNQCINSIVFKYFDQQCSHYFCKMFVKTTESGLSLSSRKTKQSFRQTSIGQNSLSFIGPSLRNEIPEELDRTTSLNIFKHNLKKFIWRELESQVFKKHYYYCYQNQYHEYFSLLILLITFITIIITITYY